MSLQVTPFGEAHLEEAAKMVSGRYRQLMAVVPCLPEIYADTTVIADLLADLIRSGIGAAATRDGHLAGFLAAWCLPSILGRPSAFSPEWASGVSGGDQRVTEALYTYLAPQWRQRGCHSHWVSLLADDTQGLEHWHWLGFGLVSVDAVRPLEPIERRLLSARIRKAGPADLESVTRLDDSLVRHISGPPIYLRDETWPAPEDYRAWLANDNMAVWIAEEADEAIAFLTIGPVAQDECTIIRDRGTASIITAFTSEERRGEGVATGLLDRCLEWARSHGYVRCAVDFEPMNPWARRFWTRHFSPVVHTVVRHLEALEGGEHAS